MFIIKTNPAEETLPILKKIKRSIGTIPPHFELFATINPKRFEMFINEIFYLSMHKTINPDFFALLRFFIAAKEDFNYCYTFNKELLKSKNYTEETLTKFENDVICLPLDERHQKLFLLALKAIENPNMFTKNDIDVIKKLNWSDSDVFDAIDHASFLYKFSKILKAYSK